MSKLWKIVIGIILAVIVIGLVGAGGFMAGRFSARRAMAQPPRPMAQLDSQPVNPNREDLPDQGRNNPPPQSPRDPNFKPDRGRFFDRGFEVERGRPMGMVFAPFLLLGALMRGLLSLAVLALLVSMTVFFYRRWQPVPAVAVPAAPVGPVPPPVRPTVNETSTEEAASENDPSI